jgi:hypothetical protein
LAGREDQKVKKKITQLSDKRYESVMKKLDLKPAKPAKKKFLIIQIDALPHSILTKFLEKGSCKYINRLLTKKGYNLHKFNCGLPSGTPHFQAGIMYGENHMIPSFRFVDKKNRRQFSFGNPNHVKHLEEKHFSKKKGILKDGASYSNHFSGDASRSVLTMSTITKEKRYKRLKQGTIWFFLLLHPASAFRVLYYSLTELLIEFGEIITYPLTKLFRKKNAIFGFRIPFRRLLMNAIMAEMITLGTIIDVKRGVPRIYLNYMNYDDIAHLRGPNSTAAYFIVRALDRRIRRICRKVPEDYDIFIISDHGQVPAVPFRQINGMTLAEFIEKCARVKSFGLTSSHEGRLSIIGVSMRKTLGFLKYVSTPLRWAGSLFAKSMLKMIKPKRYRLVWDEKEKILVLDSCSLANVYFNVSKERMDLNQINRKYPQLVKKLANNRGIGIVLAKQGKNIVLLAKNGKMTIGKSIKRKGNNFLKRYGDENTLIKQIREFNRFKFVGDLVLFGNYKDGATVSFTDHVGSHGGIGGDMMHPFFISKKKYDFSKVTNARELHKIFKDY